MKNSKNSNRYLLFTALTIFLLLTSTCSEQETTETDQSLTNNAIEAKMPSAEYANPLSSSYITSRTFQELATKSNLVITGKVEVVNQVVNLARNVNDISIADPNILNLGQVYKIAVTSILKGNITNTVSIVQPEGFLMRKPEQQGQPIADDEIQLARQHSDHIAFTTGHEYLFFLEPLLGFNDRQYFVGVSHPWRFDITNQQSVFPETPWDGAALAFPPKPLTEVINEIGYIPTPIAIATFESPLPTPSLSETPLVSPLATPEPTMTVEPNQIVN